MDSNSQSSGICQRLFRFILGGLQSRPEASTPVLVEEGGPSRKGKESFTSEVEIEFRHAADPSDGLIMSDQENMDMKGKSKSDRITSAQAKGEGVKKSVTIMETERKEEAHHNQGDDLAPVVDDQLPDDTKPRRHWPLLSVASNINQKTEEFIEKKKKDMSRNYSLDQNQKK